MLKDCGSDCPTRPGAQATCAMLRGTRRLRRALSATAATDADAAAIIQSHLFDFDDLTRLRYPGTTTFAGSS